MIPRVWLSLLLASAACGHTIPLTRGDPSPRALSFEETPESLVVAGMRAADLVVLAVPDTMVGEGILAYGVQWGFREAWWNVRLTVDSVAKGKLGRAKFMDYGTLPSYLIPARPFRLANNQIVVQHSNRWRTAALNLGARAVYFLKKCYNCVELPGRTQYRVYGHPWFAVLALSADQWGRVLAVRSEF